MSSKATPDGVLWNAGETQLLFLAPGDVLKGRVEPTIWMRMCQEFGQLGLSTELLTPYAYRRENVQRGKLFEHYGIPAPLFRVRIMPTPLTPDAPLLWYRMNLLSMHYLHALRMAVRRRPDGRRNLVIYSRSPGAIHPYLRLRQWLRAGGPTRFVFETHVLPTKRHVREIARATNGVVVSSKKLAADMQGEVGISPERLHPSYLAPNTLPLEGTPEVARERVGLPAGRRYVVYTGKLLLSEVKLLLETAKRLAAANPPIEFVFVGGNPTILAECRQEAERQGVANARFTGFVSPAEVVWYQLAADVLVLYLLKDREIIDYITPSKVFDYLRAGRPIVISEYPILHEILSHGQNALFVPPHRTQDLAATILSVLDDPALAARLSEGARRSSQLYSWERRVSGIWNFIRSSPPE